MDSKLTDTVFPTMRPDKVSLVAKSDNLICAFGAQYLRVHRQKHFVNVTSRKMRELSRILMEMKKSQSSIQSLEDALNPQNYDLLVSATKRVAGYNEKKEKFTSPTFAMNISTALKQCCNIAIMKALKSGINVNTAQIEADLKTLMHLIEAN